MKVTTQTELFEREFRLNGKVAEELIDGVWSNAVIDSVSLASRISSYLSGQAGVKIRWVYEECKFKFEPL